MERPAKPIFAPRSEKPGSSSDVDNICHTLTGLALGEAGLPGLLTLSALGLARLAALDVVAASKAAESAATPAADRAPE